jgi:hypothetical protein
VISDERINELANDYLRRWDGDLSELKAVITKAARESAIACIDILERRALDVYGLSSADLRAAAREIRGRL